MEALAMSSGELREQFSRCGYEIANPRAVTPYVVIRDPAGASLAGTDYRILMAIVYASPTAALDAHRKTHAEAELRIGDRWPFSDDNGPQLLAGYGGSVWRGNVALVQSSMRTLASMYSYDSQTDEARLARPELLELSFVPGYREYGVDRDFVSCLEQGTFAEAPVPASDTAPVFINGRPW
jgi:hypothetical protein